MWLQLPPFEPVLVLNFQFVLIKLGHPLWLQATCSAGEAIDFDGHKSSVGHTSH